MPAPELTRLIVERDWAAALLHTSVGTEADEEFSIEYCWLIRVAGGKVVEVVGFYADLIDLSVEAGDALLLRAKTRRATNQSLAAERRHTDSHRRILGGDPSRAAFE